MERYQDILRDHTSRAFARKTVNTSLLLLPLRLETKIMQRNQRIAPEPARVFYVFKALWILIQKLHEMAPARCAARRNSAETEHAEHLESEAKYLMDGVLQTIEQLDLVYPEDKARLTDLCRNLYDALPTVELQDAFEPVVHTLAQVPAPAGLTDSRTVRLLDDLERATRLFERTTGRIIFAGRRRAEQPERYSQTVRLRAALKHYRQFAESLKRIERDYLNVPFYHVTPSHLDRFNRLSQRWNAALQKVLSLPADQAVTDKTQIEEALMQRHYFDVSKFSHPTDKEFDELLKTAKSGKSTRGISILRNRINAYKALQRYAQGPLAMQVFTFQRLRWKKIGDFLRSRIDKRERHGSAQQRYTLLVSTLLAAGIRYFRMVDAPDRAQRGAHKRSLKALLAGVNDHLCKTYFNYIDERRFTRRLLNEINDLLQKANLERRLAISFIDNCALIHRGKISRTKPRKSLCVRIYPDVVALTQTARQVSRAEYLAGKDFWLKYIYRQDQAFHESLWLALCDLYPAHRAAFILRRTFPAANYSVMCRKAREMKENGLTIDDFVQEIDTNFVNSFPTTYVDNGDRLFTVPVTDLLPTRFVVHAEVAIGGHTRTIVRYGHRLPDSVQVGLDMNDLEHSMLERASGQGTQQLYLAGGLRWMTDYAEAERLGMAITVPLDAMSEARGARRGKRSFEFRSIFVYGIHDASEAQAALLVEQLMTAHLYSGKAMDLIPFDTASNILTGDDSVYAFDSSEAAQRERFRHQAYNCVNPHHPESGSDLDILDRLFCLPSSVLGNVDDPQQSGAAEVQLSRTVNRLMTGYLTDPALAPAVNPLLSAIKADPALAEYLYNDVLPRGPFPMLRIGDQPYGILPACDFRYLAVRPSHPLSVVKKILMLLTVHWNNILATNVTDCYAGDKPQATLTTQDYLSILGTTPQSTSFYERKMAEGDMINPLYFRGETWNGQMQELYDIAKGLGLVKSIDDIRAIIPNYQAVPLIDIDNERKDVDSSVVRLAEDLQLSNITSRLKNDIEALNRSRRNGPELSTDPALLNRLAIEYFDLFNYRLDAWLMGLLAGKIRTRIQTGRHRIALGCFGWLFNLKENDGFKLGCTDEYILAPSINQAVTGAILRSSYNNSVKSGRAHDYDMGVNLSSERVRTAIRIIHGIQNGLSLGAILGADLERYIHDAWKTPLPGSLSGLELDACIYPLRKRYPLSQSADEAGRTTQRTTDATSSISVINASRLLEDYRVQLEKGSVRTWLANTLGLFAEDVNHQSEKISQLTQILDWVDDELDALTDVVLSESVYKLTQGNTEAADAISRALDEMKNIPLPDVTEIPITSAQIDGHLLAMLPVEATAEDPSNVLAAVEPKVNAWIGQQLYAPATLYAATTDCELGSEAPVLGTSDSLGTLGITPAELVYLSADRTAFARFIEVLTWLRTGQRTTVNLDLDIPEADSDKHSLAQCLMAVDELRRILVAAHPLQNDDLVKETGLASDAVYDDLSATYHNLAGHVTRLEVDIQKLLERYEDVCAQQTAAGVAVDVAALPDDMVLEAIRLLVDSYRLGHTSALDAVTPDALIGSRRMMDSVTEWKAVVTQQNTLFQSLATVLQNVREKSAQARQAIADAADQGEEGTAWRGYAEAIKALLVSGYLVVPTFRPDASVPLDELARQAVCNRYTNVTSVDLDDALADLARVEQPAMALHQVRLFQKVSDIPVEDLRPMQIVSNGNTDVTREWLGAAVKDTTLIRDAYTYLTLGSEHIIAAADQRTPVLAGLVLDHWVDRIPYRDQTAAVAFGYDQPDAEAPQTLLLAVSTKDGCGGWNEQMLINTMKSAIHMVKCRMVNPDMLASDGWASGLFPLLEYRDLKK